MFMKHRPIIPIEFCWGIYRLSIHFLLKGNKPFIGPFQFFLWLWAISGTTTAIFWQWRKDHQDTEMLTLKFFDLWTSLLSLTLKHLNSTTCQPGLYACSHQVWNFFPLYHHVASYFFIQIDCSSPLLKEVVSDHLSQSEHFSESCSDTPSGYIFKLALERVL